MTILQLYIRFSCVFGSILNVEINTTDSIQLVVLAAIYYLIL
jgi:hypothetical protein